MGEKSTVEKMDKDILECKEDILRVKQALEKAQGFKTMEIESEKQTDQSEVVVINRHEESKSGLKIPTFEQIIEKQQGEISTEQTQDAVFEEIIQEQLDEKPFNDEKQPDSYSHKQEKSCSDEKTNETLKPNQTENKKTETIEDFGVTAEDLMELEKVWSVQSDEDLKKNKVDQDNLKKERPAVKQKKSDRNIPEFNLARQIMAQQRENISARRKAPAKTSDFNGWKDVEGTVGEILKQSRQKDDSDNVSPAPAQRDFNSAGHELYCPKDKIISEIVARDIDRLMRLHC